MPLAEVRSTASLSGPETRSQRLDAGDNSYSAHYRLNSVVPALETSRLALSACNPNSFVVKMPMRLAYLAALALFFQLAHGQEFSIRIITETDTEPQPFPFNSFGPPPGALAALMRDRQEAMQKRMFPVLLSRMFAQSIFDDDSDDEVENFQPENPDTEDSLDGPLEFLGAIASRMAEVMGAVNNAMLEDSSMMAAQEPARVRVVCPIMRACASDIQSFCADAKDSQVAGAVAACLKVHSQDLSPACFNVVSKHEHKSNAGEATATNAPTKSGDETSATPKGPCHQDLVKFCTQEQSSATDGALVRKMACLSEHAKELSPKCSKKVSGTPAFACAQDALRLCPSLEGRKQIARCLHSNAGKLSPSCRRSVGAGVQAVKTHQGRRVVDKKLPTQRAPEVPHASHASASLPVIPIVIGVCMAAVLAAVVIFVRRRYRGSPTVQVQLVQPPIFQPAETEEL